MNVTIHLHTILQKQTETGMVSRLEVSFPEGILLADVIKSMDVALPLEALLLAVNGRIAQPDQRLADGDVINLMPAISGG
jgi:sulfur carrier protein ThiS